MSFCWIGFQNAVPYSQKYTPPHWEVYKKSNSRGVSFCWIGIQYATPYSQKYTPPQCFFWKFAGWVRRRIFYYFWTWRWSENKKKKIEIYIYQTYFKNLVLVCIESVSLLPTANFPKFSRPPLIRDTQSGQGVLLVSWLTLVNIGHTNFVCLKVELDSTCAPGRTYEWRSALKGPRDGKYSFEPLKKELP